MLDADAVMRGRQGIDSEAFMEAVQPVIPDAYRLAYGMVRSREEASDIVQEATLSAWRHRGSFRRDAEMRPWFLAIVANECRQAMRRHWWSVLRRPDLTVPSAASPEALVEEGERLREALRQLNHSDRLALVLRYYLDLSFSDVALTLDFSPAAARVRVHRALARLRPIIGAAEDPGDE